MNNVKIVFTDLDSTLTKEPGVVDIKNKEIFEKLKEKGIYVVINTGRPLSYIIPICKKFSTSRFVIASNGAEIYDIEEDKMLFHSLIDKESLKMLDSLIKKYNLFFMANSGKKRYSNKKENKYIIMDSLENLSDVSQVVLESYSSDDMKLLKEDLSKDTSLIIANQTRHVVENKLLYVDIVNKNVSKGIALEFLSNYLGISLDDTMGIGDSGNDIEMLKKTYYKVAVENATDELKNVANIITLSNKNNGVYDILDRLYKELK